jgi:hypothetical protein
MTNKISRKNYTGNNITIPAKIKMYNNSEVQQSQIHNARLGSATNITSLVST